MEGFATGFALAQATRPGHSVENDKFRVTFTGVMCNEVSICNNRLLKKVTAKALIRCR
jgi:hypothetical protein